MKLGTCIDKKHVINLLKGRKIKLKMVDYVSNTYISLKLSAESFYERNNLSFFYNSIGTPFTIINHTYLQVYIFVQFYMCYTLNNINIDNSKFIFYLYNYK